MGGDDRVYIYMSQEWKQRTTIRTASRPDNYVTTRRIIGCGSSVEQTKVGISAIAGRREKVSRFGSTRNDLFDQ